MAKRIELKPVPLSKPQQKKEKRRSIDMEVQTNPPVKRDIIPESELQKLGTLNEESSKGQSQAQPAGKKSKRQQKKQEKPALKVPEFSIFEFELSREQLDALQEASKDVRVLECMRTLSGIVYEQSDGYFKANPNLKKYFDMAMGQLVKQFSDFEKERFQERKIKDLINDRSNKDLDELRKNEAISELIIHNHHVWDRKVQLQLNGFTSGAYERYMRQLQQTMVENSSRVSKDFIEVKLQQMTGRVGLPSLTRYESDKKHVEVSTDQLSRMATNNMRINRRYDRIGHLLARLMDCHRAETFGDRCEYQLWHLADPFTMKQ